MVDHYYTILLCKEELPESKHYPVQQFDCHIGDWFFISDILTPPHHGLYVIMNHKGKKRIIDKCELRDNFFTEIEMIEIRRKERKLKLNQIARSY